MIPYNRHHIDEDDIAAVTAVLKSDFLTQGNTVTQFEDLLATRCKVKHAVAVSSGTAGLHLACLALGVKCGDCVWTSPISFIASANAGLYCGADIDFVDIDTKTGCISVDSLTRKLAQTPENKLPKVLIVVNYAGHSADIIKIKKLSVEYRFFIIEDSCHAFGGEYAGEPVGCCRYSDISVFSFHPIKSITTAEGGALLTNNDEIARRAAALRTHGINREAGGVNQYVWSYDQTALGFNYRMSDVQAAIGIGQMKKLDKFIARRTHLASLYAATLPAGIAHVAGDSGGKSAHHLYAVLIDTVNNIEMSNKFFSVMRENGIFVQKNYRPIYHHSFYRNKECYLSLSNAEEFYIKQASLPIFYDMDDDQVGLVADKIRQVMREI
ncbi:MAG: UDP-4-amino-4,6-dideoxy-N-acetyl-beta-L-altrosamine transaminase [Oceanospirillaceae bacterium]|nr:UDP-4-amino-4,6-dideoxy-N-acetyl-beta-L-altrosamine transaminase [Oceanospirillaceae bacterium]MCP5350110.1 UDP-4-amino-4,6-dideoxy-N-acetyl-beta-L-altrosamine transaminase [Oceanospirillaceae bacterium]